MLDGVFILCYNKVVMKKKLFSILLVLMMALSTCCFAACDDDIQQGYVTVKEFKPAGRTMFVTYTYIYTGKIMIPVPHYWYYSRPDRWSLTIKDGDKKNTFWVEKEVYDSVSIGDWYNGSEAATEEPYTDREETTKEEADNG